MGYIAKTYVTCVAPTSAKQYLPVVYASLVIIAISSILSILQARHHTLMLMNSMSYFMGTYFMVYALPKLRHPRAFATLFAGYDLLAGRSRLYAYVYPGIELTFGIIYLSGVASTSLVFQGFLSIVVICLSLLNILGISNALRTKKATTCGCLGSSITLPLSNITLAENGLMLVMAFGMLILFQPMTM